MGDSLESIRANALLTRVERASADLREAIQEAHGLLKDIKQAKKDIDDYVSPGIDERIEIEVKKQLELLEKATKKAIDKTTEAIFKRFDRLNFLLMGDGNKKPSIEALIEQKVKHGTS